jgi:hypothetical protein
MDISAKIQQLLLVGASNLPQDDDDLQTLLADYAAPDFKYAPRNEQLLAAAAIVALLNKTAAQCPDTTPPELLKADSARPPLCSAILTNALTFALRNEEEEIITEFARRFDDQKWRLPDYLLPDLLQFAVKHTPVQPYISRCVGARGAWLAAQNPAWQYITTAAGGKIEKRAANSKAAEASAAQVAFAQEKINFQADDWTIDLPEKLTPELKKLGLKANLHSIEGGEKASFLWQLLAVVPPNHWLQAKEKTKEKNKQNYKDLLHNSRKSEWIIALTGGLLHAAIDFDAQDLLAELHRFYLSTHHFKMWKPIKTDFLAATLDADTHEKIGQLYLDDALKNGMDSPPFISFMMQTPHWPPTLALATLQLIITASQQSNNQLYYGLRALLQRAAYCAPADILPQIEQLLQPLLGDLSFAWQKEFDRLSHILKRRQLIANFYQ